MSRDLLETVRRAGHAGPPPPPPPPLSDEELDRRIRASLNKILGEMESSGAGAAPSDDGE
jgi:hypothetical protein